MSINNANMPDDNFDSRDICFVIVYDHNHHEKFNLRNSKRIKRRIFENNLLKNGVQLSKSNGLEDPALCFVKVMLPWETLLTYADLMKMKMPLKTSMLPKPQTKFQFIMNYIPSLFALPKSPIFSNNREYQCTFRKDRMEMFKVGSPNTFFPMSKKILIAYEILSRTFWGHSTDDNGIQKLLNDGVYIAAYPLHDGKYKSKMEYLKDLTIRQILYKYWASPRQFYKYQPIPLIRRYFGERISIYFTWLGFYTLFLIPPAIIGLVGFIHSIIFFGRDDISTEICNNSLAGSFVMCPLCDDVCDYWQLSESCLFAQIANVFDNDFTIFFSIFMSLWGNIFLHYWIRKENDLQYKWSTYDFEIEENKRPTYEMKCKHQKLDYVTNEMQWYMHFGSRFPRILLSFLFVISMIALTICIVFGVILFRITITNYLYKSEVQIIQSYINLSTSLIAAFVNLCAILILNQIFRIIALRLTDVENPRTETEYDDSFTLKMYLFQFINFYSSLVYIAFFKGTFSGKPGSYTYTLGWRQEECDPAGCMVELCIQMLVIFVGKQILNNVVEYSLPVLQKKLHGAFYQYRHRNNRSSMSSLTSHLSVRTTQTDLSGDVMSSQIIQCEKDFHLCDSIAIDLFDEYLEMVIQFGFITLFAAAMPLSPILALLNNVLEIRMDAYKMLTKLRRPIPREASNIGVWYHILKTISLLAVVTNGFIICYTSTAIPRMIYRFYYNKKHWNLLGYTNFSLSIFNVSDFQKRNIPTVIDPKYHNLTSCRYRDFRTGPSVVHKYEYSTAFWHVLAARLAFVIIFEHFIFLIIMIINWMVPEIPKSAHIRKQQEKHINIKLLYRTGLSEQKSDSDNSQKGLESISEELVNPFTVRNPLKDLHVKGMSR